jgi:diguanylate cyclase (GGDEF)-like protein/PAS domain S-box-containing protein
LENNSFQALSQYIDLLLDAICVVDEAGNFVFVSAGAERIFGYSPQEMTGRHILELLHPEDQEKTLAAAAEIMAGQPKIDFENRYIHKNGQVIHVLWSARWSSTEHCRVAVARDISRLKRSEARQAALFAISEAAHDAPTLAELYSHIHRIVAASLPAANFAILRLDEHSGSLRFVYRVAESTGCTEQEQQQAFIIAHAQSVLAQHQTLCITRPQVRTEPAQHWLLAPLKQQHHVLGAVVLFGPQCYSKHDQELLEFVSHQIAAAIERKQLQDKLQQSALYDQLTGVPNRLLFTDRFQAALSRARREHALCAVLYLDLDKFKQVNDMAGHATGDLLLQQAAQRIQQAIRASDTVARFGGDEFVVLLESIDDVATVSQVAEKVRLTLNQPFEIAGQQFCVFASIGIAIFPTQGNDETLLLQEADRAMYLAKKSGGNCIWFLN